MQIMAIRSFEDQIITDFIFNFDEITPFFLFSKSK
jgi:hypothetical protein